MENVYNGIVFEDVLSLTDSIEPRAWDKHNLTIIRDGYFDDGLRIYVVAEQGYELAEGNAKLLSNAFVVSEDSELFGK